MQSIEELIERDILRLEYLNLESNINKLAGLDTEIHRYLNIFNDKELEKLELNREDLIASSKTILTSMLNSFKEIWNLLSHNRVEDKLNELNRRMLKLKNSKEKRIDPRYDNIEQDPTDLSVQHLIETDNTFINSLTNLNTLVKLSTGMKNKYYWTKKTDEIAIKLDSGKGDLFKSIDMEPYAAKDVDENILGLLQDDLKYTLDFPLQKLIFVLPDFSTKNSVYVGGYGYKDIDGKQEHLLAANRLSAKFIKSLPKGFNDATEIANLTETFIKKRSRIINLDLEYQGAIKSVIETLTAWLNNRKEVNDDEYQSKQDRFTIVNRLGKHLNTHEVLDTYIRYLNQQINKTDIKNNNQEWESMRHY